MDIRTTPIDAHGRTAQTAELVRTRASALQIIQDNDSFSANRIQARREARRIEEERRIVEDRETELEARFLVEEARRDRVARLDTRLLDTTAVERSREEQVASTAAEQNELLSVREVRSGLNQVAAPFLFLETLNERVELTEALIGTEDDTADTLRLEDELLRSLQAQRLFEVEQLSDYLEVEAQQKTENANQVHQMVILGSLYIDVEA